VHNWSCCTESAVKAPQIAQSKIARVDLISDALQFGELWSGERDAISNAIGYALHRSRSHDAVIRVYVRLS